MSERLPQDDHEGNAIAGIFVAIVISLLFFWLPLYLIVVR